MTRIAWIIAALMASVVGLPSAAGAEPPPATARPGAGGREVDLSPKFKAGRQTRYQMEVSSSNRLKSERLPDLDGEQTLSQTIDLRLNTVSVTDEGATVEFVYDRIRASLETREFKAVFDSAAPTGGPSTPPGRAPGKGTPPATPASRKPGKPASTAEDREMSDLLATIMRPMVGTKLTMTMDKAGNIKSVSGGGALAGGDLSSLMGGLGGGGLGGAGLPTGGAGGAAAGPMAWTVNSPGQKARVRVGETWTNNDSLGGTPIGGFAMVTKHTCKSASDTAANFSFTGRADAKSLGEGAAPAAIPGLGGGFQLVESSYNGTYAWDLTRGELREMAATLTSRIEQPSGADGSTRLDARTRMNIRRQD